MILNAVRLHRDRVTERDTFGYIRPVWSQIKYIPAQSPSLGCPIEADRPIQNRIVKLVERYKRDEGEFIIERFCWHQSRKLHPFRARYIRLDKPMPWAKDILFLPNLQNIHRLISGINICTMSSLQHHLSLNTAPWNYDNTHEYLRELHYKYAGWIDGYSWMYDDWVVAEEFIESFDRGFTIVYDEEYFNSFILPRPKFLDPFSIRFHDNTLSPNLLNPVDSSMRGFDLSEVAPLEITHPELTLFSPIDCHTAVGVLEHIYYQYTDVKVEYILNGNVTIDTKQHYRINRYLNPNFSKIDDIKDVIINDVIPCLARRAGSLKEILSYVDDIRAVFTLTYGEEALVEIFDNKTQKMLGAVHFDMAMLSLCTADVAIYCNNDRQYYNAMSL